jgi:hypothetical protein
MAIDAAVGSNGLENFPSNINPRPITVDINLQSGTDIFQFNQDSFFSNTSVINNNVSLGWNPSTLQGLLDDYTTRSVFQNDFGAFEYLRNKTISKDARAENDFAFTIETNLLQALVRDEGFVSPVLLGDSIVGEALPQGNTVAIEYSNPALPETTSNFDIEIPANSGCGHDSLHFINGDLTISPPFLNEFDGRTYHCTFVVNGNLIIKSGEAASTYTTGAQFDSIQAFFIVDGATYIEPDTEDDGLYINGGIITQSLNAINELGEIEATSSGLGRSEAVGSSETCEVVYAGREVNQYARLNREIVEGLTNTSVTDFVGSRNDFVASEHTDYDVLTYYAFETMRSEVEDEILAHLNSGNSVIFVTDGSNYFGSSRNFLRKFGIDQTGNSYNGLGGIFETAETRDELKGLVSVGMTTLSFLRERTTASDYTDQSTFTCQYTVRGRSNECVIGLVEFQGDSGPAYMIIYSSLGASGGTGSQSSFSNPAIALAQRSLGFSCSQFRSASTSVPQTIIEFNPAYGLVNRELIGTRQFSIRDR